ncbi:MAG: hypothetical protein KDE26_16650 [Bacteroidetes bacterium]|nr:hypothetical protein [Bacteroidota bacterium]MCB0844887.1 hypothetical protein [Bacteroidota bacterium]
MQSPKGEPVTFKILLEKFKKHIKEKFKNDPTAEVRFKDRLFKRFGSERNNWGDFHRKIYDKNGDQASNVYINHRRQTIKILYEEFDVPFDQWLYDPELFSQNGESFFINLEMDKRLSDQDKKEKFQHLYVSKLRPYLEKARSSIQVYDYTGRGRSSMKAQKAIPYYSEAHEEIYRLFESLIVDHQIKYSRYLVLPRPEIWIEDADEADTLKDAMIRCSLPTYKHVVRCLVNKSEEKSPFRNCNFYVVPKLTCVHHFGIIDSTMAISEYYRYDSEGDFIPYLLFVDQANKKTALSELISVYQGTLNKLRNNSKRCYELDLYDLKLSTKGAFEKTNEKLTEYKKTLRKKEADNEPPENVRPIKKELSYWEDEHFTVKEKIEFFNSFCKDKIE